MSTKKQLAHHLLPYLFNNHTDYCTIHCKYVCIIKFQLAFVILSLELYMLD